MIEKNNQMPKSKYDTIIENVFQSSRYLTESQAKVMDNTNLIKKQKFLEKKGQKSHYTHLNNNSKMNNLVKPKMVIKYQNQRRTHHF